MGNTETKSSNQKMVDSLVTDHGWQEFERPHIRTARVEGAFRAVDRAMYYEFDKEEMIDPYTDEPWRRGNLHISAPCIYARVVEALDLKPGISFLNLGSGTGYLNTIVGLLIGPNGVNHGIELHQDVVDYAYKRLEKFKNETMSLAKYDFAQPIFIRGNCLKINPSSRYDRIYLGAACLPESDEFIKKLLKPNGAILVMPHEDHLMRYIRLDEQEWRKEKLMRVSFTLMIRQGEDDATIEMPLPSAMSLKELCRISIRQGLRNRIDQRHPKLLHSDNLEARRKREAAAEMYESARALGEANALFRSMGFRPAPLNNLTDRGGGLEAGGVRGGRRSARHKEFQRRLRASRRERGHTCGCCHVRAQTSGRHTINASSQHESVQPEGRSQRRRGPTASSSISSRILTRSASRRLIEQQQQQAGQHNNLDTSSSDLSNDDEQEDQEANQDDSSDDDNVVVGQHQASNCARTRPIVLRRASSANHLRPRCLHNSLSRVYNSGSPFGLAAVTNRRLLTTNARSSASLMPAYHRRNMARFLDATLSPSSSSSSSASSSSASPSSSRASPAAEEFEYVGVHGRGGGRQVVLNWPGFLSISGRNNNEPPTLNLAHCARLLPSHSPLSSSSSSSDSSNSSGSSSGGSSDEDENGGGSSSDNDASIPDLSLPDATARSSSGGDTPVWNNQEPIDYEDSLSCPFSDGHGESSSDSLCDLSSPFHSQQSDLEGGNEDDHHCNVGNRGGGQGISLTSSSATFRIGANHSSALHGRLLRNESNNEPVARRLRSKRTTPGMGSINEGGHQDLDGHVGTSGATITTNSDNNNNRLMDRLLASSSRVERRHQHRHRGRHHLECLIQSDRLDSHHRHCRSHHCRRHHSSRTSASTSTLEPTTARGSEAATIGNQSLVGGSDSSSNQDMFTGRVLIATALGTNILSMSEHRYLPAAALNAPTSQSATIETRRRSLRPLGHRSSALSTDAAAAVPATSTNAVTTTTGACHHCRRHSSAGGQLEDGRKRKRHRSSSSDSSSWSLFHDDEAATTATGRRQPTTQGAPSANVNHYRQASSDKAQFNSGSYNSPKLATDRRTRSSARGKTTSGATRLSRCELGSGAPAAVSGGAAAAANERLPRCGISSSAKWRLNLDSARSLIDTSSDGDSGDSALRASDGLRRHQAESAAASTRPVCVRERSREVEQQLLRGSELCRGRRQSERRRRRRRRRLHNQRRSTENECQRYHRFMSGYIRHLELPRSLHSYLNYDRDH